MTLIRRHGRHGMLAAVLAVAALAVLPAAGHASAGGYAFWGVKTVKDIPVPRGTLWHRISGKGYRINEQAASYSVVGAPICDVSVRWTYGNGRTHADSAVQRGCHFLGVFRRYPRRNASRGDACVELWIKNRRARVATQCHYIHG
jgi:hypothetical protein